MPYLYSVHAAYLMLLSTANHWIDNCSKEVRDQNKSDVISWIVTLLASSMKMSTVLAASVHF